MSVYGQIAACQGGQSFANLARRFGIREEQAAEIVGRVLPALLEGFRRTAASPQGAMALLRSLSEPGIAHHYDDPSVLNDVATLSLGQRVAALLLPADTLKPDMIDSVSRAGGVSHDMLRRMLPYVTVLTMGAIRKRVLPELAQLAGEIKCQRAKGSPVDPCLALSEAAKGEPSVHKKGGMFGQLKSMFARRDPPKSGAAHPLVPGE